MRIISRFSSARRVPWANGKGETTELVTFDSSRELGAGDGPAWRLSIARLTEPGPFSPLPGIRRWFLPVGGWVVLTVDGARTPVPERTVAAFAGDDHVALVDLEGPCHAVNLMVAGAVPGSTPLVLGQIGDDEFDRCMAAVVLDPVGDLDRFDLVAPGRPDDGISGAPVALILRIATAG